MAPLGSIASRDSIKPSETTLSSTALGHDGHLAAGDRGLPPVRAADPSRWPAAADPADRELRLSCGAALFNLRLALRSVGVRPLVSMLPGLDAPGALAVVRRSGTFKIDDEHRALLGAVLRRRTNRRLFIKAPSTPASATRWCTPPSSPRSPVTVLVRRTGSRSLPPSSQPRWAAQGRRLAERPCG
jgi:hypothetical protein